MLCFDRRYEIERPVREFFLQHNLEFPAVDFTTKVVEGVCASAISTAFGNIVLRAKRAIQPDGQFDAAIAFEEPGVPLAGEAMTDLQKEAAEIDATIRIVYETLGVAPPSTFVTRLYGTLLFSRGFARVSVHPKINGYNRLETTAVLVDTLLFQDAKTAQGISEIINEEEVSVPFLECLAASKDPGAIGILVSLIFGDKMFERFINIFETTDTVFP
jgi:hypothetical protein